MGEDKSGGTNFSILSYSDLNIEVFSMLSLEEFVGWRNF